MKRAVTRELYRYWDALRGSRPAPDSADLHPAAIRSCLADLFVLDCEPGYPFRLAGTSVCALFGHELAGDIVAVGSDVKGFRVGQRVVRDEARQPVGAQQPAVARARLADRQVRRDVDVEVPEHAHDDGPLRVVLGLLRLDPAGVDEVLDEGVVLGHLAQLAAAVGDVVAEAPETSCISVSFGGRPVFEHNDTLPLEPASTNKILTSYAILQEAIYINPKHDITDKVIKALNASK